MRTLVGVLALALGTSTAFAADTGRPTLRLKDADPVTLVGAGFAAGDKIRVSAVVGNTTRAKVVRSTPSGTFRVVFSTLAAPNVCAVRATAVGSTGAKAVYRLSERMCPIDGAAQAGERVP